MGTQRTCMFLNNMITEECITKLVHVPTNIFEANHTPMFGRRYTGNGGGLKEWNEKSDMGMRKLIMFLQIFGW